MLAFFIQLYAFFQFEFLFIKITIKSDRLKSHIVEWNGYKGTDSNVCILRIVYELTFYNKWYQYTKSDINTSKYWNPVDSLVTLSQRYSIVSYQ